MERCLSLTSPGLTVPELAALAAWGEGLGYRTAWLAEVAGPESMVAATAAALATGRMTLGVAVVPAFVRTPALLAMAAGSVSQVLAGRTLRVGIGSSSEAIVSGWNGVPFVRPLRRVEETVRAVREGLSGSGSFQGATVGMNRFKIAAPPAGPVELFVGALGPRMLAVAGAVGDGVCLNLMPPEVVPRQLAATGRSDEFGVMARLQVLITEDVTAARTMLRETMLAAYLAQPVYNNFLRWMGYEEEAAAIASGWAARDREAVNLAIHDRLVDDLAILGTRTRVLARIDEYFAAGIQQAAVSVLSSDRATVESTLRALAP